MLYSDPSFKGEEGMTDNALKLEFKAYHRKYEIIKPTLWEKCKLEITRAHGCQVLLLDSQF